MTKATLFPPFRFRAFVPRGAPILYILEYNQFGIFKSLIVFLHSPILGTVPPYTVGTVFISHYGSYVNSIDPFNAMSLFVQSFIDFIY